MNSVQLLVKVFSYIGLLSYCHCSNQKYEPFMWDTEFRIRVVNWSDSTLTLVYGSQREELDTKVFGLKTQVEIVKATFVYDKTRNVILRTDDQHLHVYDVANKNFSHHKLQYHSMVLPPPPTSKSLIQLQQIANTTSKVTTLNLIQRIAYDGTVDLEYPSEKLEILEHTKWVTSGEFISKKLILKDNKYTETGDHELWAVVYTQVSEMRSTFLMRVELEQVVVGFFFLHSGSYDDFPQQYGFSGAFKNSMWVRKGENIQAIDLRFASLIMSMKNLTGCVEMSSRLKGRDMPCIHNGKNLRTAPPPAITSFKNFPTKEYTGGRELAIATDPPSSYVFFTGLQVGQTHSSLYVSQCLNEGAQNVGSVGCPIFPGQPPHLPGGIKDARVYNSFDSVMGFFLAFVILPGDSVHIHTESVFPCRVLKTCHECESIGYYVKCFWSQGVCNSGKYLIPPTVNKCFQISLHQLSKKESYSVTITNTIPYNPKTDIITISVNGRENISNFHGENNTFTFETSQAPDSIRLGYRRTTGFETFSELRVDPQEISRVNNVTTDDTKSGDTMEPANSMEPGDSIEPVKSKQPTTRNNSTDPKKPTDSKGSTLRPKSTMKTVPDHAATVSKKSHLTTVRDATTDSSLDDKVASTLAPAKEGSKSMMTIVIIVVVVIIAVLFLLVSRRKSSKNKGLSSESADGPDMPIVTVKSNPKSVTSLPGNKPSKTTSIAGVSEKKSKSLTSIGKKSNEGVK